MEKYLYEFEKDILEEMYKYALDRSHYYQTHTFTPDDSFIFMIGDFICTSYQQYDANHMFECIVEWISKNEYSINDFFIREKIPPSVKDILPYIRKFINEVSDDIIVSYGLDADIIRKFFNAFNDSDSLEIIFTKIEKINFDFDKVVIDKDSFDLEKLIHTIWPYIMPYLFSKKIKETDTEFIELCKCNYQASIDLVNKYKKEYYKWAVFYNRSIIEYTHKCDFLAIRNLKDIKYQFVNCYFENYLSYIDNMPEVFMSFHNSLGTDEFGRYLSIAIIDNSYVRPFYNGYLEFCKNSKIKPNFIFDFEQIEIDTDCRLDTTSLADRNENKEPDSKEVKSHLPRLSHFTDEKLMKLLERFRQYDLKYIKKNTREEDWLFVFGMKGDTPPERFEKVKWRGKNKKKQPTISPLKFVNLLEILGYNLDELYNDVGLLNRCFIANEGNKEIHKKDFDRREGKYGHVADYQELKKIVSEIGLCP